MRARTAGFSVVFAGVIALACSDLTAPAEGPELRRALVDARTSGTPGFYFLPPLAPAMAYPGEFDPARTPAVDICALEANGACGSIVTTFTMGPGPDGIRVNANDQHFITQWHTTRAGVAPDETYRATVRDGALILGYADVRIVRRASDASSIPPGFIPLVAGSTLPIKFRIEKSILGPPVSATVGTSGGRVDVPLGDGSVFTMDIPAGALNAPVEFIVTPKPNGTGAVATVGIVPSNPGFQKAVGIRITTGGFPPGANVALAAIAIRNGADPATMFLPTVFQSGVFLGSTSQFGPPSLPPSAVVSGKLATSIFAAEEVDEAELSLVLATVAERIAAFRAAADALSARLRFEDAVWYRTEALVLAQLVDDPQAEAAMTEARVEACTAMGFHFSTAEGRLGDQFSNLWSALRPVIVWKASADITGVESSECPQTDDFTDVTTALIEQFTGLYTAAMEHDSFEQSIGGIESQLYDAFAARKYGDLLAQEQAFARVKTEIQLPLARRYRKAAYDWCRTDHEQQYLGSLFRIARDAEMYAPGLPEVSDLRQALSIPEDLGFNAQALSDDIQYCGTGMIVFTRDIDGLSSRKGVVGGREDPGSRVSQLDVRIAPHGKLELDSVLVALVCENEEAGNDRIHIRLNGVRVREFERVAPTAHFIRNTARVLDVDAIADSAGIDLSNGGTFPLVIERESDGCGGAYSLPEEAGVRTLVTLNLTYPDVDVSLDPASLSLQTGGAQAVTATVTGSTTGVTWEVTGGTSSISGNTLTYTAGSEAGSFEIKATSVEDTAKSATATVQITDPGCIAGAIGSANHSASGVQMSVEQCPVITVDVGPDSATLLAGMTRQFTANVEGTENQAVTWQATGGTISASGMYTAGAVTGFFSVTATSVADPSASSVASVRIAEPVAVFGAMGCGGDAASFGGNESHLVQAGANGVWGPLNYTLTAPEWNFSLNGISLRGNASSNASGSLTGDQDTEAITGGSFSVGARTSLDVSGDNSIQRYVGSVNGTGSCNVDFRVPDPLVAVVSGSATASAGSSIPGSVASATVSLYNNDTGQTVFIRSSDGSSGSDQSIRLNPGRYSFGVGAVNSFTHWQSASQSASASGRIFFTTLPP